jgi:hypothetical protein
MIIYWSIPIGTVDGRRDPRCLVPPAAQRSLETVAYSPDRLAEDPGKGGHLACQAVDGPDRVQVATHADPSAKPEPRRDGHRRRFSESMGDRLQIQLVSVDKPRLEPSSRAPMSAERLGLPDRSVAPIIEVPSVEAESRDDRSDRASTAETSDQRE